MEQNNPDELVGGSDDHAPVDEDKTTPPDALFLPAIQEESFDAEKVRQILEYAKAFQAIANEKAAALNEVSTDIQLLMDALKMLLIESGLNELFMSEEPPDQWTMIATFIKMIKKVYRAKDDPDSVYVRTSKSLMEFLKKYGNKENFDEHGQFKLPE